MQKLRSGFSLIEIMVVVALIGLLVAIVVPHVLNARRKADQKTCINNLRQIDQAVQQWAAESKASPTTIVTHTNLVPYLRKLPACPTLKGGTFFTDYGLTYVGDASFCIVNVTLAGTPHILNGGNGSVAARGGR